MTTLLLCLTLLVPGAWDADFTDNTLHMAGSFILSTTSCQTARTFGANKTQSYLIAALTGLAVGVAKEATDKEWSWQDIEANCWGVHISLCLTAILDHIADKRASRTPTALRGK
jgi:S-methylmethionine-dependent homocysteine/selenocysteine methylase